MAGWEENGRILQGRRFDLSLSLVRFACDQDKVARYFAKSTAVVLLKYRGGFVKVPRYFP